MLSDARSIWSSISNAASSINDNINTALETPDNSSDAARQDNSSEELQIYKKLLDDAQMHHVELSQASRVLVAEKDAELKYWRKKSGADEANFAVAEGDQDITMERLIEERDALQETLILIGAQLRDSLRESNEAKVLNVKYKESQARYDAIKTDFRKFSSEVESQNKQKNDTIENLVAEYSKLVTESFHRQNGDASKILDATRENEALGTKVRVLEHSISEIADRVSNESGSGEKNRSNPPNELHEVKAKLVNVQFDLKERDIRIHSLMAKLLTLQASLDDFSAPGRSQSGSFSAEGAAHSGANISLGDNSELMLLRIRNEKNDEDLRSAQKDVARLQTEKNEAEVAGKGFMEKVKALQREIDESKTRNNANQGETLTALTIELATARQEIKDMRSKRLIPPSIGGISPGHGPDSAAMEHFKTAYESQIHALRNDIELLQQRLTEAAHAEKTLVLKANYEKERSAQVLYVVEKELANARREIEGKEREKQDLQKKILMTEKEGALALNVLHSEIQKLQFAAAANAGVSPSPGGGEEGSSDMLQKLYQTHLSEVELFNIQIENLESQVNLRDRNLDTLQKQYDNSLHSKDDKIEALQNELQQSEVKRQISIKNIENALMSQSEHLDEERDNAVMDETIRMQGIMEIAVLEERLRGEELLDMAISKLRGDHNTAVTDIMCKEIEKQKQRQRAIVPLATPPKLIVAAVDDQKMAEMEKNRAVNDEKKRGEAILEGALKHQKQLHDNIIADMIKKESETIAFMKRNESNIVSEMKKKEVDVIADIRKKEAEKLEIAVKSIEKTTNKRTDAERDEELRKEQGRCNKAIEEAIREEKIRCEAVIAESLANEREFHKKKLKEALKHQSTQDENARLLALEVQNLVNIGVTKEKEDASLAALNSEKSKAAANLAEAIAVKEKSINDLNNAEIRHGEMMKVALKEQEAQLAVERAAALKQQQAEMQNLVNAAIAEKDELLTLYSKESKLRKNLHNKLLEIHGNIRVICRVRPVSETEKRMGDDIDITDITSENDISIIRDPQTKTRYEYDRVFAPGSTQLQVFETIQPLCVSVLDGYNVCIFAYGQTGSGKTHTMEGKGEDKGVSPRAVQELFLRVESTKMDWQYTLTFSMLEIYNESILDLLDSSPAKEKLDIRQGVDGGNVVTGLKEVVVEDKEQVYHLMVQGQKNRAVGSHDMNEHSSRSHSILTIAVKGKNLKDGSTTSGKLHLIDLAGSERTSKTDATGDRLKEAQNINRSLSALGDVINALGNKKTQHVPFRNSKLTFLLQDSLGGNSKVLMFVNISPANYNVGETLCSLNFATRCRNIELGHAKRMTGLGSSSSSTAICGTGEKGSMDGDRSSPKVAGSSHVGFGDRRTVNTSSHR